MIWTKLRELAVTAVSHALKLFLRGRSPDGRALPDIQNPDILVIKPASIGDVLMATPVLECLRRALPGARVTLAVGSWSHVAVANSPDIDGLIDCGKVGTPGRYGLREYLRLVRVLRRRHFDVATVLDRSPLMALLPYFAGVKYRLGPDSGRRGIGLTTASPPPRGSCSRASTAVSRFGRSAGAAATPACPPPSVGRASPPSGLVLATW